MVRRVQITCRKCDSEVIVELDAWTERVDVKARNAKIVDRPDAIEIRCKECGSPVAVLGLALPLDK